MDHFCGSSLHFLQFFHVLFQVWIPYLDAVFQLWPNQWSIPAVLNVLRLADHLANFVLVCGPPRPAEQNFSILPSKMSSNNLLKSIPSKTKNSIFLKSILHKICILVTQMKKSKIFQPARGPPGNSPRTTGGPRTTGWKPLIYTTLVLYPCPL